ncbi:hypothetical protein WH47_10530 [Habropoda laboriosa]|uniref:Uncharacterized protein n=1 Tax=Habropoda laboriosa TaxID=597456 RepID=A0A0L7QMW4_9HYME|nr:hypothetical protein WH47_10530 [Habropoda laboriosa]
MKLKSFYTQVRAQALDLLPGNNLANTNTPAQNSDGQPNQSSPYSQTESIDIDVQLPKINLPTFSGNYEDWPGFADQFRSAVHDNVRISDCKKLTYLRSCLKGEALKGIELLTNSAANYGIAWTLLEKQYNQPAVIVSKHLKALFDLPSVTRPAHRELRSFLCNVEAHYRSLQPLKQPTPDTLLIHLLLTKLDKDTALKWREYTRKDSFPTLNTFFEFLHERCQVLEPLANHYLPHPNPTTSAYTPRGQIAPRHQTLQRGTPRPSFRDHRQMAPQVYGSNILQFL